MRKLIDRIRLLLAVISPSRAVEGFSESFGAGIKTGILQAAKEDCECKIRCYADPDECGYSRTAPGGEGCATASKTLTGNGAA